MTRFVFGIFIVLLFATSSGHAAHAGSNAGGSLGSFLDQNGFRNVHLNRRFPNWLTIPLKINQKPAVLVVATACPTTGIDRGSAEKFGLSENKTTMAVQGSLGRSNERYGMSQLGTLEVGKIGLSDVRATVLNFSKADRRQPHVDGFFGFAEMRRLGAVIDCSAPALYVNSRGPSSEMSAQLEQFLLGKGFTRVPMKLSSQGHPEVNGAINGHPLRMTVDTAAFVTCINNQTAAKAAVSFRPSWMAAGAAGGLKAQINFGRAKELYLGNFKITDADLSVVNVVFDSIGAEHLSFNSAIIDIAGMNLYLRHSGKPQNVPSGVRRLPPRLINYR